MKRVIDEPARRKSVKTENWTSAIEKKVNSIFSVSRTNFILQLEWERQKIECVFTANAGKRYRFHFRNLFFSFGWRNRRHLEIVCGHELFWLFDLFGFAVCVSRCRHAVNGHLVLLLAEHSGCDFLFDQRFGAVTSSEFGCCGFVHLLRSMDVDRSLLSLLPSRSRIWCYVVLRFLLRFMANEVWYEFDDDFWLMAVSYRAHGWYAWMVGSMR